MKLIAIDPGVTTGVCVHRISEGTTLAEPNINWFTREFGPEKHHRELYVWLYTQAPHLIIVERFDYQIVQNKGVKHGGVHLESREYIGIAELVSQQLKTELYYSSRTLKTAWTKNANDRLKRLGLHNAPGGRQHMNDAQAHMLAYLTGCLHLASYVAPLRPEAPDDPST